MQIPVLGAQHGFGLERLYDHKPALIVLSHLRWGFVFQRPQHLLTRLAQDFHVYFIEEPVHADGPPVLAASRTPGGVELFTPHTPATSPGFSDEQMPFIGSLLAELMAERGIAHPFVWLYTPMALPLVADLEPCAVVYDCMDDLASFKFAPPQLVEREAALMQLADVVLTGGPSLYERRKDLHPSVHCLPSAVDAKHFAAAGLKRSAPEWSAAAALHEGLPHPRLGFFGVIDERLDIELIAALADLRPDWQLVMVGPVVKIAPESLPTRPNIRWLGMQSYDMLPYLQSHWDVCLLPFALNEATRFISPTKTLEYLAGGKQVVGTPILDVQSLYGEVVRIAGDAPAFAAAVQEALDEDADSLRARRAQAQALVDGCTWDGTAHRIRELLGEFLPRTRRATPAASAARIELTPRGTTMQTDKLLPASAAGRGTVPAARSTSAG